MSSQRFLFRRLIVTRFYSEDTEFFTMGYVPRFVKGASRSLR